MKKVNEDVINVLCCLDCGNSAFFYEPTKKDAFAIQGYLICTNCGRKKSIKR